MGRGWPVHPVLWLDETHLRHVCSCAAARAAGARRVVDGAGWLGSRSVWITAARRGSALCAAQLRVSTVAACPARGAPGVCVLILLDRKSVV